MNRPCPERNSSANLPFLHISSSSHLTWLSHTLASVWYWFWPNSTTFYKFTLTGYEYPNQYLILYPHTFVAFITQNGQPKWALWPAKPPNFCRAGVSPSIPPNMTMWLNYSLVAESQTYRPLVPGPYLAKSSATTLRYTCMLRSSFGPWIIINGKKFVATPWNQSSKSKHFKNTTPVEWFLSQGWNQSTPNTYTLFLLLLIAPSPQCWSLLS